MSKELLPEICSNYEETDVRIIIYIGYIQTKMPHIKTVRVRAKDIFFILLYYAKSFTVDIIFDMGNKLTTWTHFSSAGFACLHWGRLHFSIQRQREGATNQACKSEFKVHADLCHSGEAWWDHAQCRWRVHLSPLWLWSSSQESQWSKRD